MITPTIEITYYLITNVLAMLNRSFYCVNDGKSIKISTDHGGQFNQPHNE